MNCISLKDFSPGQIRKLLSLTKRVKGRPHAYRSALKGKYVGLLFEKPSLRTKTAFYVGTFQLGGTAIYYSPREVQLGAREKVSDVAKTLSGYLDAVIMRTFSHESVLEFGKHFEGAVINGLSDLMHPSQALADIFTVLEEKKSFPKTKIVYFGDGNNVAHSLIYAVALTGGTLSVVTPRGHEPCKAIVAEAKQLAKKTGGTIVVSSHPRKEARGADVLYTDVWTSMGKEKERAKRKKIFKDFQINGTIVQLAKKNCMVMHCLPAHRGEEITDSVIDSKHSVVFTQAQNRLYTAQAILLYLLGKK